MFGLVSGMLEVPVPETQERPNAVSETCSDCEASALCMSGALDSGLVRQLAAIIRKRGPFRAGELIYRRGAVPNSIYSVQRGLVKTETVTTAGERVIGGFVYCGELLGTDAMGRSGYPADAVALTNTWLCEIPMRSLEALMRREPGIQRELLACLGRQLDAATLEAAARRQLPAYERLLAFLQDHARRVGVCRHRDVQRVPLPMAKQDIAVYLGLTPESLSRTLLKLQKAGVIRNYLRYVELLTPPSELGRGRL